MMSTRYRSQRRYAVFAWTAAGLLLPGGCGRTSLSDARRNPAVDAADDRDVGVRDTPAGNTRPDLGAEARSDSRSDGNLVDGGDVAKAAEVNPPVLRLLAGALGGCGNLDATGALARFCYPAGVASDGAGNLFVTDPNNHAIRKVAIATGSVSTFAGPLLAGSKPDSTEWIVDLNSPRGIANDGAGNLFITDSDTVLRLVIATGALGTLAGSRGEWGSTDGTGANARFNDLMGVASDGLGNLFVADRNNHTIRKVVVATSAVSTFAGYAPVSGTTDGVGSEARFDYPSGVASDGAGNLFVADQYNDTIRKVVIATAAVSTLAGSPGESGSTDGTGPDARFDHPSDLATDGEGDLLVVDQYNQTIRKLVIATGAVSTLAGSPGNAGSGDGMGPDARFNYPAGLATDGAGNLFVVDPSDDTIRKVVIGTGAVSTLAGAPRALGSSDGVGAGARFNSPQGMASDDAGNLFVADGNNGVIRRIDIATAKVTTLAGSPRNWGNADGTGAAASFAYPAGMASDGAGSLFVVDSNNHTIRRVVPATGAVTTLAGSPGTLGSADGVGAAARFRYPRGIASDGAGSLFVADSMNHTLRKVDIATAAVTTLAGLAGSSGSSDGTGTEARFYDPEDVAGDGAGSLFVADSANNTIRKVDIVTGAVTTLAGSAGSSGSSDGTGTLARFLDPCRLASDGAGNLFVADLGNNLIRKIVTATGAVTTVVGSPRRAGVSLGPLPAGLNTPRGLAFGPKGELFIADENSVLVVQL